VGDLFTVAKQSGYSIGSVFWPVTGCHPSVDYLLNEYWMPLSDDTLESAFRRAGSSEDVLQIANKNKDLLPDTYEKTGRLNMMVQPFIDNFLVKCACDIIHEFTPEIMFVHNGIMDNTRHKNGVFNQYVTRALNLVDNYFGMMMVALEEECILEETNIVIISDHGQMDFHQIIKPNVLLARNGYLDVSENGHINSWKAYSMSNAMSAMIFLREPNNHQLFNEVYEFLSQKAKEGIYGFNKVFTRDEITTLEHLDGDFSFVIESDGYTSFSDDCLPPIIGKVDLSDFRSGYASHGYLPDKGPQPVFIAKGPDFRNGVTLPRRPIVDVAPTFAKILDVNLPAAQGTSMDELLK